MAVSKVSFDGADLINLENDTVGIDTEHVVQGYTFHGSDGVVRTGTATTGGGGETRAKVFQVTVAEDKTGLFTLIAADSFLAAHRNESTFSVTILSLEARQVAQTGFVCGTYSNLNLGTESTPKAGLVTYKMSTGTSSSVSAISYGPIATNTQSGREIRVDSSGNLTYMGGSGSALFNAGTYLVVAIY